MMLQNGNSYRGSFFRQAGHHMHQTKTFFTPTEVLQALERIILIKQYTSNDKTAFSYGILVHDPTFLETGVMKYVTMPNIPGMTFKKILEFKDNLLAMVFASASKTQVHIKNVGASGPAQTVLLVANTLIDPLGGNSNLIYDQSTYNFYRLTDPAASPAYTVVPSRTSIASTQFGPVIAGILNFYKLVGTHFVITTYNPNNPAAIRGYYGWIKDKDVVLAQGADETSTQIPIAFSNKFNFVYITTNILVWHRLNSAGVFQQNALSSLAPNTADYNQIKADFRAGIRVSFNLQKVFILSQSSIKIYELSTAAGATTVNKVGQMILGDNVVTKMTTGTQSSFRVEASCQCQSVQPTALVCFSSTLKCITAANKVLKDCTVAYVDNVPQAV